CGGTRRGAGEPLMPVREPVRVRRRRRLQLLGLVRLHLDVEEVAHDLLADDGAELLEHRVPLGAVLDKGVLLRHRAQVDAVTEVFHRVEVLAPAEVDDLEDEEALYLAHELRGELLLLVLVDAARVVLELGDEIRLGGARVDVELVGVELRIVERLHLREERIVIPLFLVVGLRVVEDDALDDVVDPFLDLLGEVLAFEYAAALLVDDHALDVHDVVVLEDVLPRDEVLLLDLLLRALDLVREDLALHGLIVGKIEAFHDLVDPVAGEQAHEIVLRGEVEARLAGVALAARAAAELVVDPARLVALGAEHVEPAQLAHTLAELDVDAAAGHVRRDRDGAALASIHDDLRLALVLLGVQDVVRDA